MSVGIDADAIPERLLWQEGDLLTQQHFQEERKRLEALLAYRLQRLDPHAWGVASLAIDPLALADGVFRVDRLEAVMPDGMLVTHPCLGRERLEIELATLDIDPRAGVCLHLAVAREPGRAHDAALRYRPAGSIAAADELTLEDPVELERLIPEISLVATGSPTRTPPARYVSLPLACLKADNDAIVLTDYVPPGLRVEPGQPLADMALKVATELRRKVHDGSRKLAASIGQSEQASAGWDWPTIRAMAAPLPRLEALLAAAATSPFELYLGLCDMAGALACLNRQPMPGQLPAYDHRDPARAYGAVVEQIETALGQARESYAMLRLELAGEGRFSLAAEMIADTDQMLLGCRVGRGQAAAAVAEWLEAAVIVTEGSLDAVRQSRSQGAARRRIDQGEELWLTPPPDVIVYAVTLDPRFLRIDERLVIIGLAGDAGRAPPEIMLYQRPTTDPAQPTERRRQHAEPPAAKTEPQAAPL